MAEFVVESGRGAGDSQSGGSLVGLSLKPSEPELNPAYVPPSRALGSLVERSDPPTGANRGWEEGSARGGGVPKGGRCVKPRGLQKPPGNRDLLLTPPSMERP